MSRRAIPWGDYASRVLSCALLFASSYALLAQSSFALRMRNDLPVGFGGLDGPHALALGLSALLAIVPLLCGPAFLRALLVCGWLASGIGAYWWTSVPWDELITESNFPTNGPPILVDYVLVASPAIVATLHVVLSRASRVRKEARDRGIDDDEAKRAAAAGFLAGAATLVVSLALAGALWALLAMGVGNALGAIPRGAPAILLAAALVAVAWLAISRQPALPRFRLRARPEAGEVKTPAPRGPKAEA